MQGGLLSVTIMFEVPELFKKSANISIGFKGHYCIIGTREQLTHQR